MRIISKFHDYYDIGLSYGIDPNLVYERKTKEMFMDFRFYRNRKWAERDHKIVKYEILKQCFPNIDHKKIINYSRPSTKFETMNIITIGFICFCGVIYPYLIVNTNLFKKENITNKLCFNIQDIDEIVNYCESKPINNLYYKKSKYRPNERQECIDFFNCQTASYEYLCETHVHFDCPIFLAKETGHEFQLLFNPKLDDYEFYRILDPYTAFQNISMFMSGVMGIKEKDTVEISDKDLKHMKGFDEKSFRKESEVHKKNKQN